MIFLCSFHISQLQSSAISTRKRLTFEQRIKDIQAYYTNGRSNKNAFRALRDYFGQYNLSTERTVVGINHWFKQAGSVDIVKSPLYDRIRCSDENIAAVSKSVTKHPKSSSSHQMQEMNLCTTTLHRILTKYWSVQAYKFQLTQKLKPDEYLKCNKFVNWVQEQKPRWSRFIAKSYF